MAYYNSALKMSGKCRQAARLPTALQRTTYSPHMLFFSKQVSKRKQAKKLANSLAIFFFG